MPAKQSLFDPRYALKSFDAEFEEFICFQDNAPLHAAIEFRNVQVVQRLLTYPAVIQKIVDPKLHAFAIAIEYDYAEIIDTLLSCPQIFDFVIEIFSYKKNYYLYLNHSLSLKLVSYFENFIDVDLQILNDQIALFRTSNPKKIFNLSDPKSIHKYVTILFYLINRYHNVESNQDSIMQLLNIPAIARFAHINGNAILICALNQGLLNTVTKLLKLRNVRRHLTNQTGEDIVKEFCCGHFASFEVFDLLHKFYVVRSNIPQEGRRLLIRAAESGALKAVKTLLTYPSIRKKIKTDNSALREAIANGHIEVTKVLLPYKYVAKYWWEDIYSSAVLIAIKNVHYETALFLIDSPEKFSNTLGYAKAGNETDPLIMMYSNILTQKIADFKKQNPDTVFDITDKNTLEYYVIILKYLTEHRNFERSVDPMPEFFKQLVVIPAVFESISEKSRLLEYMTDSEDMARIFLKYSYTITDSYFEDFIKLILKCPEVLSYAESKPYKFEKYTTPFLTSHLKNITLQMDEFKANNPNEIFNLTDEKLINYSYIALRNLLRKNSNSEDHIFKINMLLSIPAVTAMAAVNGEELLFLTIQTSDLQALNILLGIPTIRAKVSFQNNNFALSYAANIGDLDIMNRLLEEPEVKANIANNNNEALCKAVFHNKPLVAGRLLQEQLVIENIAIYKNQALLYSLYSKNTALFYTIFEYDAVKKQLAIDDNDILSHVKSDAIDILKELLKFPNILQKLTAENNKLFREAVEYNYKTRVYYLLEYPDVLNYAEQHAIEYGQYIKVFIDKKIEILSLQIAEFNSLNVDDYFEITDENTIKIYWLILRNLIRTFTPENNNLITIELLLNIPDIARSAADNNNELLQLAIRLDRIAIIPSLMNINAINTLAEQNNYYMAQNNELDLPNVIYNAESSMVVFSEHETKIMQKIRDRYAEKSSGKIEKVISDFIDYLKGEYAKNPLQLKSNATTISLPLAWKDLQKLKLSPSQMNAAFISYYKSIIHTAYRYFLKPNPWQSPTSSYSTFKEYLPIIADLWLAVSDINEPARDGIDFQGRINNFICSIALINRAHNYHKIVKNKMTKKDEEHDDLQGDKPSCPSGVKRRLLHSVIAHSAFSCVTKEILDAELRSFVYEYYKELLNSKSLEELGVISADIEYSFAVAELPTDCKIPDIPIEKQAEFFDQIRTKHNLSDIRLYFNDIYTKSFECSLLSEKDPMRNHFLKYYTECNLKYLLATIITKAKNNSANVRPRPNL